MGIKGFGFFAVAPPDCLVFGKNFGRRPAVFHQHEVDRLRALFPGGAKVPVTVPTPGQRQQAGK
jgi:hypothetical protein